MEDFIKDLADNFVGCHITVSPGINSHVFVLRIPESFILRKATPSVCVHTAKEIVDRHKIGMMLELPEMDRLYISPNRAEL